MTVVRFPALVPKISTRNNQSRRAGRSEKSLQFRIPGGVYLGPLMEQQANDPANQNNNANNNNGWFGFGRIQQFAAGIGQIPRQREMDNPNPARGAQHGPIEDARWRYVTLFALLFLLHSLVFHATGIIWAVMLLSAVGSVSSRVREAVQSKP